MPQTAVSPCVLLCRLAGRGCWTPACASRLAPDSSGPGHRWLLSRPARLSADLLGSTPGHAEQPELQPRNAAPPGRAGLTLQHPSQVRRTFARARTHQLAARVERNARTWPTAWTRIPVWFVRTNLAVPQAAARAAERPLLHTPRTCASPKPAPALAPNRFNVHSCVHAAGSARATACSAAAARCAVQSLRTPRASLCLRAIGVSVLLLTSLSATSVQSWADSGCLVNILRDVGRFASGQLL